MLNQKFYKFSRIFIYQKLASKMAVLIYTVTKIIWFRQCHFSRFHIHALIYNICFYLSDWRREWDEWRKHHWHIYTVLCKIDSWWEVGITQEAQPGTLLWPREVRSGETREAKEIGDICVIVADSCCYTAGANTT